MSPSGLITFILLSILTRYCTGRAWRQIGGSNFVGEGTNDLSVSVLQNDVEERRNYVFSPLGYSTILAILAEGARGNTRNQLVNALRLPEDTYATRSTYKKLLESMQERGAVNKPEFKNWFYVYKNYSVEELYKKILKENYLTEVRNIGIELGESSEEDPQDLIAEEKKQLVPPQSWAAVVNVEKEESSDAGVYDREKVSLDALKGDKGEGTSGGGKEAGDQGEGDKGQKTNAKEEKETEKVDKVKEGGPKEGGGKEEPGKKDDKEDRLSGKVEEQKGKLEEGKKEKEKEVDKKEIPKEDPSKAVKKETVKEKDQQVGGSTNSTLDSSEESSSKEEEGKGSKEKNSSEEQHSSEEKKSKKRKTRSFAKEVELEEPAKSDLKNSKNKDILTALSANRLCSVVRSETEKNPRSRMIVFNGLYFRGNWSVAFEREAEATFYTTVTEKKQVRVIETLGEYKTGEVSDLDATAIEIPYEGERYSLLILLPKARDGLAKLTSDLTGYSLRNIDNLLAKREVELSLPKFKFYTISHPKDALIKSGISDIFDESADLSGISGRKGLYLDDLVQLVTLEVDEGNSNTNFLTSTRVSTRNSPARFCIDHPFLFFLRDRIDNLVVVAGKVVDPQVSS